MYRGRVVPGFRSTAPRASRPSLSRAAASVDHLTNERHRALRRRDASSGWTAGEDRPRGSVHSTVCLDGGGEPAGPSSTGPASRAPTRHGRPRLMFWRPPACFRPRRPATRPGAAPRSPSWQAAHGATTQPSRRRPTRGQARVPENDINHLDDRRMEAWRVPTSPRPRRAAGNRYAFTFFAGSPGDGGRNRQVPAAAGRSPSSRPAARRSSAGPTRGVPVPRGGPDRGKPAAARVLRA